MQPMAATLPIVEEALAATALSDARLQDVRLQGEREKPQRTAGVSRLVQTPRGPSMKCWFCEQERGAPVPPAAAPCAASTPTSTMR